MLRAVAHPRGPDGRTGIHTELLIAVERTDAAPDQRTMRVWVPGGRLGRHVRVISHQPRVSVNQRGVFLTAGSSLVAVPVAHVVTRDASASDPVVALESGEELRLTALRDRLRMKQVSP